MEPKRKELGHEVVERETLPGAKVWKIFDDEIRQRYTDLNACNILLMWRSTFGENSEGSAPHGTVHILNARERCLAAFLEGGGEPVDVVIVLNQDVWKREKDQVLRGMALDLLRYVKPSLTKGGDDQQLWTDDGLVWAKRQPIKIQAESVRAHGAWSHDVRHVARAMAEGSQIPVDLAEREEPEDSAEEHEEAI